DPAARAHRDLRIRGGARHAPANARRRQGDRAGVRRVDARDVSRRRRHPAGLQTVAVTAWILGAAEAIDSPHAGGKAKALARAERAGLPVPPWFVLSATAFEDSLTPEQRAALAETIDPDVLARVLDRVSLAPAIVAAIAAA